MTRSLGDLAVAVLAGGKSRRMGQDKGLIKIAGRPMAQWAVDAVLAGLSTPPGELLFITGNTQYDRLVEDLSNQYANLHGSELSIRTVNDIRPDHGPLGGIETALSAASTETALVIACDLPLVDPNLIAKLLENLPQTAMAESNAGPEPCLAAYSKANLKAVSDLLDKGQLEARTLAGFVDHLIHVSDPVAAGLKNINTPADLEEARTILSRRTAP